MTPGRPIANEYSDKRGRKAAACWRHTTGTPNDKSGVRGTGRASATGLNNPLLRELTGDGSGSAPENNKEDAMSFLGRPISKELSLS
jgi:hypothetical protein